ncbi:NnrS family protein [Sphingomicrobium nitratireducens]|uniref:NnrS family protein n=1 Tax=Sphingomicrobium nitratireducens TaxID=2964666 RepID=UPI00223ECCA5|nr:NnrS family protein [Sphingomicrobium nitratireducens]
MSQRQRIASGQEMLNLRRARMAAAPPLLRGGFRPFFLGGALWAIVTLVLWLVAMAQGTSPVPHLDALAWHRHEMLFGFVGAVVAGFILTAVPNWTGRLPIAGWPLAMLASAWLAARLLPLWGVGAPWLWLLLDAGFYIALSILILREILLAGNRNLPIALMIFAFGLVDAADLAAGMGWIDDPVIAVRAGLALVVMMISLIGGRITPSFTRNWLMKQGIREGLPVQPGRFDQLVLLVTAGALLAFVIKPFEVSTGAALIGAAIFQLARLGRWRGWRTMRDPLVLILHVGYLWLPLGLGLLGLAALGAGVPHSAAVHALTAGAMATMILGVMSRATLGHTGRELRADRVTTALYVAITLAAIARVAAPLGWGEYMLLMRGSALLWIAAFTLFAWRYGPMLLMPRADDK